MKIKRHIPSLFTIINLFLGFLAILNVQLGNYNLACYFILIAGFLDSMDGKIARAFGISTDFGMEIDSLADMVSFCLAPSVMVYHLYTFDLPGILGEIIAAAPLIFGAIRLARFNVNSSNEPSSVFIGLPTPAAALSIAALVLFTTQERYINPEYTQPRLILPAIFCIAFLMVSKVNYPKFPLLNMRSGFANTLFIFLLITFFITFIMGLIYNFESRVLMLFTGLYIFTGIFKQFFNSETQKMKITIL
ncbi:MAG: CDP-diacylglycerol--serine O-phosphatidyltransferase [Candidatus Marinimicrobia bacterium]|nr:CDP-diacylglycerol--serine O-phosphatidyltransferase [Candidatus Neomarinimicrobiota bacterium]